MTEFRRRLLGMGVPFLLAFMPDTLLAIASQTTAVDGVLFRQLGRFGTSTYILGFGLWAAAILGLLLLLPEWIAVILTIAVVFSHTAGVYLQLTDSLEGLWYQAANLSFLLAAVALGVGLTWSARVGSESQVARGAGQLPAPVQWGLIACLAAMAFVAVWHP